MGIIDKIKNLFKKKDKGEGAAAPKKVAAKKGARRDEFKGEGKVGDSLRYAADKIDAKVAAGKMTDARAAAFMGQLKGVEASDAADDAKEIQISQIIGGIING